MKIKYILGALALLIMAACGNDYEVNENFDLEELPGYVAFDAPGNDVNLDDVTTTEDGDDVSITIECPTGTLSDITVTYDLGGTAILGTDYDIASPGSIVIPRNPNDFEERDMADLVFDLLEDNAVDGTKTIVITLTGASNAEGSLAVGRGGLDILKTTTITIGDIDCDDVNFAGTYEAVTDGQSTDSCCPDPAMTTSIVEITDNGDGTFTISDWSAGLYLFWYEIYGITPENQTDGSLSLVLSSGPDTDGNGTCDYTGSGTEPFAETVAATVTVGTDGTLGLSFSTGFDDTGTAVLTPQ